MAEEDILNSKTFPAFVQNAVETYDLDLPPFSGAGAPYALIENSAIADIWKTAGITVEKVEGTAIADEMVLTIERWGIGTKDDVELAKTKIPIFRASGEITSHFPFSAIASSETLPTVSLRVNVLEVESDFPSLRGVKATVYREETAGGPTRVFASYDKEKVEAYAAERSD